MSIFLRPLNVEPVEPPRLFDTLSELLPYLEGVDVAVAGGAVRDTVLGALPKDFDIVALDEQVACDLAAYLARKFDTRWLFINEYEGEREEEPANDFWDRWSGCFKIGNVDILVTREVTYPDAVATFDNTLNMFAVLPGETEPTYMGDKFAPYGIAQQMKPVSARRLAHIEDKAYRFNWHFKHRDVPTV